jgi:hypothetical protein
LHPYGSVAITAAPDAAFMSDLQKALQDGASGLRSDVTGGGRNFLNPAFSDQSNLNSWGNAVVGQGRGYGVGDMMQYYGVAPGQLPVQPFCLNLGAGASGLQGVPDQLSQTVAPELTKFTSSLASADTGLGFRSHRRPRGC